MRHRWAMAGLLGAWGLAAAGDAAAQPMGTYSWQLQPFCNVVTVSVTQNGGVYTLDGFDNQCGTGQRAPLVGLATPNPDGSIGLGLNIVTVPGGRAVHVDARVTLPQLHGSWSDSVGNSGNFVFGGAAAGLPARPAPTVPGFTIAPGTIGSIHFVPGAVGSAAIADGTVGAVDVDSTQVQLRLNGTCPSGLFLSGVDAAGTLNCRSSATGGSNTALGLLALQSTVLSDRGNTAIGNAALRDNTTGSGNVAIGQSAMLSATAAQQNVAVGPSALGDLTTGPSNVAVGLSALGNATTGGLNVGVGFLALFSSNGTGNTAVGYLAGSGMTTGGNNTALGYNAGMTPTTGSNNIHIGNAGVTADTNTIKIGIQGTQVNTYIAGIRGQTPATATQTVVIGTDGELGSITSSRRFKDDIADMGDASGRIFDLRPVTFRYKQPMRDGSRPIDFGLIAEEVAEVLPELATTDQDGVIDGVAYHKLPAMLLNELQKQQRTIESLQTELAELKRLLTQSAAPR